MFPDTNLRNNRRVEAWLSNAAGLLGRLTNEERDCVFSLAADFAKQLRNAECSYTLALETLELTKVILSEFKFREPPQNSGLSSEISGHEE